MYDGVVHHAWVAAVDDAHQVVCIIRDVDVVLKIDRNVDRVIERRLRIGAHNTHVRIRQIEAADQVVTCTVPGMSVNVTRH